MLTFQPQSFQSCSLAVIFILVALQHHWMLYIVLNLESSAFLFHLLSSIPLFSTFSISPTNLFHHLYSPAVVSLISCLPSWQHKQPPILPSLTPDVFRFITSLLLHVLHTYLPPTVCSSITFTHMATHKLPLRPCPLFTSVIHPYPYFIPQFCSHAAPMLLHTASFTVC